MLGQGLCTKAVKLFYDGRLHKSPYVYTKQMNVVQGSIPDPKNVHHT